MNGRPSAAVRHELDVRLVVPGTAPISLPVTLGYESADPYAVHALFRTGQGEGVAWVFARDTLATGVDRPTGEGDVRVWPATSAERRGDEVIYISLSSPDGHALLEAPAAALTTFLLRTYALVPPGTESAHVDVDAALAALLA
jgi:hypothetical protein